MTIYLDYIFLENLVINVVIILQVNSFFKLKLNKYKIIICALIDSVFSVINYLYLDNFVFSLLFTSISFYFLFQKLLKTRINFIRAVIYYFIVYISYIGIIILIECITSIYLDNILNKLVLYFVSALINNYILNNLWKMWKTNIKENSLSVVIEVVDISIDAFVDTGNLVKDYSTNLNVIFIQKNLKEEIINKLINNNLNYELIKFNVSTINGINNYDGYVVNNIKIKNSNDEAIISKIIFCFNLESNITNNTPKKYSAIIGYETYLDNFIGGV